MPPDSYVDCGAVLFCTPLNRTGEQSLTDEKSNGRPKIAKNKTDKVSLLLPPILGLQPIDKEIISSSLYFYILSMLFAASPHLPPRAGATAVFVRGRFGI